VVTWLGMSALGRFGVAIVAGLLLLLIPTLFSVFPEWTRWSDPVRIAIVALWFATAVLGVTSAARQSRQVEELVGEPLRRRQVDREVAGAELVRLLLTPTAMGLPAHYEARLFLPDDSGRLMPSFEREDIEAAEGWEPGQGATGIAWQRNTYAFAENEEVSDDTLRLDQQQQQRYRRLNVVASMPVQDARGRAIGVLSISSPVNDGKLLTPAAVERHAELARIVGRVLIDILRLGHD
jgi:hypothetical protein